MAGLLHENVQSLSQPSPSVRLLSSQSSPGSVMPFGQTAGVQTPDWQKLFAPQGVLSVSGVPGPQVWVASSQVPWPSQGSVGVHALGSLDSHENVQSLSQPSPSVTLPSSQSSVALTNMSPHASSPHTPPLQMRFMPHEVPSAAGWPGSQL